MKKIIEQIILVFLAFLTTYLMFTFVTMEWNVLKWNGFLRLGYLMISFNIYAVYYVISENKL